MDFTGLRNMDMPVMMMFNDSDSLFMDNLMYFLTNAFTWIPIYVMLLFCVIHNNKSIRQMALVVGMVLLMFAVIDISISSFIKPGFMRLRPGHDHVVGSIINVVNNHRGGAYGFFSAHAANTISLAIFFSLLMRSVRLTVMMVTWSLINCVTRMYLGMHYPSDILCGLLFGSMVSVGVYYLYMYIYNKVPGKMNCISAQYTSSGYSYVDINMILVVFTSTILVGMFYAVGASAL